MQLEQAAATGWPEQGNGLAFQDGRRRHVLDLDDFSRAELEMVLSTTDAMREVVDREIKKAPTLRGKSVMTVFYEPSTRTRVSFEQAAKILSADVVNLTVQASSVAKGESLLDTLRTLEALRADAVVIRHPHAGAPYLLARHLQRVSVINAGDGAHAHPTQALLDLYTIRQHMGSPEGAKVVILGDVTHSRVARSNLWGLGLMGARVVLCGPPTLMPWELVEERGRRPDSIRTAHVEVETRIERALDGADVVMVLRLQHERQEAGLLPSLREYARLYQLNEERLALAKPKALVLHPGPMNEGVEISPGVAHGAQSVVQEQVTNGVAIRMALLYLLLTRHPRRD